MSIRDPRDREVPKMGTYAPPGSAGRDRQSMARGGQPQWPLRFIWHVRGVASHCTFSALPGGPSSILSRIQLLDGNQKPPLPATLLPHNIFCRESPTQLLANQANPSISPRDYDPELSISTTKPTPHSQTPELSSASLPPPYRPPATDPTSSSRSPASFSWGTLLAHVLESQRVPLDRGASSAPCRQDGPRQRRGCRPGDEHHSAWGGAS